MALTKKKGCKVTFTHPISTSFEVETPDTTLAFSFALDLARGRYPNKDWSKAQYRITDYAYNELNW